MLPKGKKMWTHGILFTEEATHTSWTLCSSVHLTGVDIIGTHRLQAALLHSVKACRNKATNSENTPKPAC